ENDPNARVAAETAVSTGLVLVVGEVTTNCYVDIQKLIRSVIKDIGYTRGKYGFDGENCAVITSIDEQSSDIAMGVDEALEYKEGQMDDAIEAIGAGDQGIMFGFACNETPELMPMPISLAHQLAKKLTEVRKDGTLDYLRPDGKTQVTVEYEDDKPVRIDTVLISTQHSPKVEQERIKKDLIEKVIKTVIPSELLDENTKYFVNPTGRFVIGGPKGDAGLTGRKIIVDTYGGYARHGGGAFSGKDPTKVDRSAAYAARYVAKNIVAAGLADKCEIELAYAIGVAKPVSVLVETFGTGKISDEKLAGLIDKHFDLRPAAIIRDLELRRPIYRQVAAYGHFGRTDIDVPWEKTDKAETLREEAGL
ncbi:MAG: methionine adenosyltransferase, partial [Clostridia bacterium]|nr:methionine adenosyltransferase [Clostridia bacterium]